MPRLAAILNQEPPLEHNVFGYREKTLLEHRPHLVRKPIIQLSAKVGVADEFNTKPDFREGHRAHIEKFERLGGDEGEDFLFWLGAVQFREYIGIEQPNHHNETSRTGISARFGAMSISRCGEACMAAIRASPVRSPLRRRNSSADMTTTSSRPCTVTRCGPSLRTRRTNSLNRALASCKIHWPNFGSRARRRDFVGFVRDDFTFLVILTRMSPKNSDFKGHVRPACRYRFRRSYCRLFCFPDIRFIK